MRNSSKFLLFGWREKKGPLLCSGYVRPKEAIHVLCANTKSIRGWWSEEV